MREKFITYDQFAAVQRYSGLPVELKADAWPAWMKNMSNIPGLVHKVIASAINPTANPESAGFNVGGIEVYRNAPEDYPYVYNKDVYPIVSGINPSGLIAQWPSKDNHDWLTQFPSRYSGIPVIGAKDNDPF